MPETSNIFSPSINIERDKEKKFDYVVTSNATQIFDRIINNRHSGTHSFSIIGSYGTGKSSFLLALRKDLTEENSNYFPSLNGEFSDIKDFEFHFIVGEYKSLKDRLAEKFNVPNTEDAVLEWIDNKHQELKKKGIFWFIIIDEFGKHLEHAAKENPEEELYFIQRLAEYANEKEKNLYFITTLHQAFDSYAIGLDLSQRKEWDKVRGRLKELTFNEPVEQLLFIASEFLSNKHIPDNKEDFTELINAIENSRSFPLKNELNIKLAQNLYPLDPLAAAILSLSLQQYGQNERSLFTFLQSTEYLGLNDYDQSNNPYYNLSSVYDYLIHNHHHFLRSHHNPHYVQWNSIKKAIQRAESDLSENIEAAKKIIKAIGLLNIFAVEGAKINPQFLHDYASIAMGVEADKVVSKLEDRQIIRYRSYKQQYILFEGTDFDIRHELRNARNKIDPVTDVVTSLNKHFNFPYLPAKRTFFEKGTPRFFEFKLSNKPLVKGPSQPIDGYINLVFDNDKDVVLEVSQDVDEPILFGVFNNTTDIRNQIFEIRTIQHVIEKVLEDGDKAAKRELDDLLKHEVDLLNEIVLNNIYSNSNSIDWMYKGEILELQGLKSLNNYLSEISEKTYSKAPTFNNELINKEKVSPAIYSPRKTLLIDILDKKDQPLLGFEENTFPAEKTIYLSLLKNTGIHEERDGTWTLRNPTSSFTEVWDACEDFFESTKTGKRDLKELWNHLRRPPYGLKNGLLEFWIPIYLTIKQDDFALFKEEAYITELNYDILKLTYRNPDLFQIKAFYISDVKKKLFQNYRSLLEQDEAVEFTNESFVETVRPFLLIYGDLNEYGRTNTKISPSAQKLRSAIKSATDPEEAFFEDFTSALGYVDLKELESDESIGNFIHDLDKRIDEIKRAYDELLDRIENTILSALDLTGKEIEYQNYKEEFKDRYSSLKQYKLASYQKKLLNRLLSKQPSRQHWLEAVCFAILDKPLEKIDNDEEDMLLDRLYTRIKELDNLRELSKLDIDTDSQEGYTLQIQSFGTSPLDKTLIVDKGKIDKHIDLLENIKGQLTEDEDLNIALLISLIKGQGNNG